MCKYCDFYNNEIQDKEYVDAESFHLYDSNGKEVDNPKMFLRRYKNGLCRLICENKLSNEEVNIVDTPVDYCPKCKNRTSYVMICF